MLLGQAICKLSNLYSEYLSKNVGPERAKTASSFQSYQYYEEGIAAAYQLREDYDYCLPLATNGLFLGFIFELAGFIPVRIVNTKRRGFGATWMPREPLCKVWFFKTPSA